MQARRFSGRARRQRGAVALLVAILLLALIGAAGIAIDLGRLFVVKTELQNAADACALAAARELNMQPTSLAVLTRAENAGITVGNRHRADFQHDDLVFVTDQDVTFSSTLTGPYLTKAGAPGNVAYVRCTRTLAGIVPWLMTALGSGPSTVAATAVASLQGSSVACMALPLGMCSKAAPPPCLVAGVTPDRFGLCLGQWYSGRFESGGSITGNFNWLDFTPHGGGASELGNQIAGFGACEIRTGETTFHAETGQMQSAKDAWNSRFGLYKNGGQLDATNATPDYTGYAYGPDNWPQAHDAYRDDYPARMAAFASYGFPADTTAAGNQTTGLRVQNSFRTSPSGAAGPHGHGSQRRVVALPVVDCSTWGPGHNAAVQGWICAFMVTPLSGPNEEVVLEYLGPADEAGAPCATQGQSGGPAGPGPKVPTLVQ